MRGNIEDFSKFLKISSAAAFNDLKELVKSYADRRELKDLSPVLDVFQRSEEVVDAVAFNKTLVSLACGQQGEGLLLVFCGHGDVGNC